MKTKSLIFPVIFLFASMLFSCNEATEDLSQTKNPEIEYKELTPDEVVLKNQLADAAKIVAEIASDQEVLDEIVATIKVQPAIISGSVKFADLMSPDKQLKSVSTDSKKGKFATAFRSKISNSNLKSASTLIEALCSKGVEIYMPYPIDEYPTNAKLVVTSAPIDNFRENIGYEVGNNLKQVVANYELTKKSPLIIVSTSSASTEQIANFISNQITQDKLKSISVIDPTSVWNDTSYQFVIVIDYLLVKNNYVPSWDIFTRAQAVCTSGDVYFDSKNGVVWDTITTKPNIWGVTVTPYKEDMAKKGYIKGLIDCGQVIVVDWHPGIKDISHTFYADLPLVTNDKSLSVEAAISADVKVDSVKLSANGKVGFNLKRTEIYGDHLYAANQPLQRSLYNYNYNIGNWWSPEHGSSWVQIRTGEWRPVRQFSPELFYVTHCEAIPRSALR